MTAKKVVATAVGELGTKESPANSNRVKYNTWYYGREVSGADYPWCMAFVQWCFHRAGVPLPVKTASCGALMRAAKKAGLWAVKDFRPGDVVIYDFPGGGPTDHCGIIERVTSTQITAIEGNTSDGGSQSNGGMVCRKTRPYSQIVGVIRPTYRTETNVSAMAAIDKLAKLGVIASPDYWKQAVSAGKVKYLDTLLVQAEQKIKHAGERSSSTENAIGSLVGAGVITSPEYWLEHCRDYPNLGALLCALGGAVK